MKAPEKIFLIRNIPTPTSLNTTNDCHEKYLPEWYEGREKDADIEYTRTDVAIKAMQWKDEQHKDIEEGLREIINALDAKLQKANESGMYYFNQCNIQKQKLIDEACEYLSTVNLRAYLDGDVVIYFKRSEFIDDFKQAIARKASEL